MAEHQPQKNIEALVKIAKLLRISINNMKIYPVTSAIVENSLSEFYTVLNEYLQSTGLLTLTEMNNTLLLDGEQTNVDLNTKSQIDDLAKTIKQREIHSITFKNGVTLDELKIFLDGLIRKKPNIKTKDFLDQVFAEQKVEHIGLDQVEYMPVVKGDANINKIFSILNNKPQEMSQVASTLGEVYTLMDNVHDQAVYDKLQERVANYMASMDIDILKDFLEQELPPKIEKTGLKDKIISTFTKDKIEDIFREVLKWCNELKSKTGSETEYITQLDKLKNFLQRFLAAPASKLVSIEIYDDLLQAGVLENVPEWVTETRHRRESILFQVDTLLEKDSVILLENETLKHLPEAVEKLCQVGLTEILEKLVHKMMDNFENTLPKLRMLASDTVIKFCEILQQYRQNGLLQQVTPRLISYTEKEPEYNVYCNQIKLLLALSEYFLLAGNYELGKSIVQLLKKMSFSEYCDNEKKRSCSEQSLKNIFDKTKHLFIGDIVSTNPEKQTLATWFILTWGEDSVYSLIGLIKDTEEIRTRLIIANVLKSFQETTRREILKNLNIGVPSRELRNIIEILHVYDNRLQDEFISTLGKIIAYASPQIKHSIINYFGRVNSPDSKQVLLKLLNSQDDFIIQETINVIREINFIDSFDVLLNIMPKCSVEIQKELCTLFGYLKLTKTIPAMIKLVKSKPGLFGLMRGIDPEIRVRACWALANFPETKEIRDTLVFASRDKNMALSIFAKDLLRTR